jgi:hypothetical protein
MKIWAVETLQTVMEKSTHELKQTEQICMKISIKLDQNIQ